MTEFLSIIDILLKLGENIMLTINSQLKKYKIGLLLFICFIAVSTSTTKLQAQENLKPLKIAHFYSDKTGFWPLSSAFAAAASEDLNIEFNSYSFGNSPVVQIELITKVLNDPKTKPDGFIFHNYKSKGDLILNIAQKANVPAVMFNSGPTPKDTFGKPKEKYPLYLALITPDDEKAGYDLAVNLINIARDKNLKANDGKIHICVLEGSRFSNAAKLRKKGLLKAVKENSDVVVDQFFDTNWRKNQAKDAFKVAIKRYPKAKVFWAASDMLAMGVVEEANVLGKKENIDFITGGIDLLPSIQPEVLSGNIALSIGAHYTESIWALLLLSDNLRGCDIKKDSQNNTFKSTMMTLLSTDKPILPKDTKDEILKWAKDIDFSKYSKCNSKKEYSFDSSEFFKK